MVYIWYTKAWYTWKYNNHLKHRHNISTKYCTNLVPTLPVHMHVVYHLYCTNCTHCPCTVLFPLYPCTVPQFHSKNQKIIAKLLRNLGFCKEKWVQSCPVRWAHGIRYSWYTGTVRYCKMSQVQSVHCDTSFLLHRRDIVFITGTS